MKEIIAIAVIVGISFLLLSVRLLCGKKNFVSSDVDDNPALVKKGLTCPRKQERIDRSHKGIVIEEHSKEK